MGFNRMLKGLCRVQDFICFGSPCGEDGKDLPLRVGWSLGIKAVEQALILKVWIWVQRFSVSGLGLIKAQGLGPLDTDIL